MPCDFFQSIHYIGDSREFGEWNGYKMETQKKGQWSLSGIAYTSKGDLWCVADNRKVGEWADGTWTDRGMIGGFNSVDISFDKDDRMFLVNDQGEVAIWECSTLKKITLPPGVGGVNSLHILPDNTCWIITKDWRLYQYNLDTKYENDWGHYRGYKFRGVTVDPTTQTLFLSSESKREVIVWDFKAPDSQFVVNVEVGRNFTIERICFNPGQAKFVGIKFLVNDPSTKQEVVTETAVQQRLENDTDFEQQLDFNVTKLFTQSATFSWSVENSFGIKQTFSITAGIPFLGEASVTTEISFSFGFKIGQDTTTSKTEEYKASWPMKVGPRSTITAVSRIDRGTIDFPFEATFSNNNGSFVRKGRISSQNYFNLHAKFEEIKQD